MNNIANINIRPDLIISRTNITAFVPLILIILFFVTFGIYKKGLYVFTFENFSNGVFYKAFGPIVLLLFLVSLFYFIYKIFEAFLFRDRYIWTYEKSLFRWSKRLCDLAEISDVYITNRSIKLSLKDGRSSFIALGPSSINGNQAVEAILAAREGVNR